MWLRFFSRLDLILARVLHVSSMKNEGHKCVWKLTFTLLLNLRTQLLSRNANISTFIVCQACLVSRTACMVAIVFFFSSSRFLSLNVTGTVYTVMPIKFEEPSGARVMWSLYDERALWGILSTMRTYDFLRICLFLISDGVTKKWRSHHHREGYHSMYNYIVLIIFIFE